MHPVSFDVLNRMLPRLPVTNYSYGPIALTFWKPVLDRINFFRFPFFPADAVERNSKKTKTAWSKEGTDENAIGEENM